VKNPRIRTFEPLQIKDVAKGTVDWMLTYHQLSRPNTGRWKKSQGSQHPRIHYRVVDTWIPERTNFVKQQVNNISRLEISSKQKNFYHARRKIKHVRPLGSCDALM
jgi:hypothetical protein